MHSRNSRILLACLVTLVLLSGSLVEGKKKSVGKRIVNGHIITIDQAPYMVQLKDSLNRQYCGGALVTSRHVVTAAHCFDESKPEDITIVGGANTRYDLGVQRKVASLVKAAAYDPSTYDMDIAVITLDKPMEGGNIKPVPLCRSTLKAGDLMQVSGWGKVSEYNFASDELRSVRLPIISREECSEKLLANDPYGLSPSMICAYAPNKDTCVGDSGGPGIHNGELCAVVSWGHGCARENSPGVYTSIDAVRSFIEDNLKNESLYN